MKKSLLLILLVCISQEYMFAQLSDGGTPPSFLYGNSLRSAPEPFLVSLENIDFTEIKRQNEVAERNGSPTAVAVVLPVDVDISSSGEWTTLPDSQRIWRQSIYATGALGIILSYEEFYIPEGGRLFIYNKDYSHILGAYTESTNPKGGKFSTQFTLGDEVILEYVASTISDEEPRLVVEDIGYIYSRDDDTSLPSNNPSVGRAPSCMVNINCEEGGEWQDQKRGVVMIFSKSTESDNTWYMCTGSLINNTATPGTPYVITANHCFYDSDDESQKAYFDIAQYYFNYEWESCENPRLNTMFNILPSSIRCLIGSTSLIETNIRNGADGQLVLLDNDVPTEWYPYYNGWDISEKGPESGVVIHHPQGDAKKISTYEGNRGTARFNNSRNRYWLTVGYTDTENGRSVTHGGSSGSPLFNEKGLIIGTLTGGASTCEYENNNYNPDASDYYGKMSVHFDQLQNTQMKTYLDPLDLGITQLEGYDPNLDGYNPSPNNIEWLSEKAKPNILIFPNPAINEVYINACDIIQKISVVDMNGRVILLQEGIKSSTANLPVSNWGKGTYNILIQTHAGNFSEKLIKE